MHSICEMTEMIYIFDVFSKDSLGTSWSLCLNLNSQFKKTLKAQKLHTSLAWHIFYSFEKVEQYQNKIYHTFKIFNKKFFNYQF